MEKILLDNNNNVHMRAFEVIFVKDDEDDEDGMTYFPDKTDIEYSIDNSMLDQANEYLIYDNRITDTEAAFFIYVNNDLTDEYMPSELEVKNAIEDSGFIDEWNRVAVIEFKRTVTKKVHRDNQLNKILI
jgi:hypothetical protein